MLSIHSEREVKMIQLRFRPRHTLALVLAAAIALPPATFAQAPR
jgi:hypothetical protein